MDGKTDKYKENKLVKVDSVNAYLDEIFKIENEIKEADPFRKFALLFRGLSDKAYDLMPSIGRGRLFDIDITIMNQERNLIEMAIYRFPEIFNRHQEPLELLALLQHYGIPTRLLDVTGNALAALYFATQADDSDGEVVVFVNDNTDAATYPLLNAIADSYRFLSSTWSRVDHFYDRVSKQTYFLEQYGVAEDSDDASRWIADVCSKPLFVYAPIHSSRQLTQKGQYILFPNKLIERSGNFYFDKVIKEIDKHSDYVAKRIIVRKRDKDSIRKQLKLCGIDQGTMFPDSVDMVCAQILTDCKELI